MFISACAKSRSCEPVEIFDISDEVVKGEGGTSVVDMISSWRGDSMFAKRMFGM